MNRTRRLLVLVQLVFSFASFFHLGQAQIPQGSSSFPPLLSDRSTTLPMSTSRHPT